VLSALAIGLSFALLRVSGVLTYTTPVIALSAQVILGGTSAVITFLGFDRSARYAIIAQIRQWTKAPVVSKEVI
jgi:hypothetical protein